MAKKQKKKAAKKKDKTKAAPKSKKSLADRYRATVKSTGLAEVIRLSQDDTIVDIPGRVSTQSLALDRILRTERLDGTFDPDGGIPLGRVTEIFGPPGVGKSTLLDHIFTAVQRMGGEAALYDMEVARDKVYMAKIGVNLAKLHYHAFKDAKMTIENVMTLAFGAIDFWSDAAPDRPVVLGFDALGGTATEDERGKPFIGEKKPKPGGAAKTMHMIKRQLPEKLAGTKVALVILNHEYQTFQRSKSGFARREVYGGSATAYVSSLRLNLYPTTSIKDSKGFPIGRDVSVELRKNRLGVSRRTTIPIIQGRGIDNMRTIFEGLKAAKVIAVNGSWMSMNIDGEEINHQGYNRFAEAVTGDEELYGKLVALYKEYAP